MLLGKIKKLKIENGIQHFSEMKWTKVSSTKIDAYEALINYFFDSDALSFRAVIVDKKNLDQRHLEPQFWPYL